MTHEELLIKINNKIITDPYLAKLNEVFAGQTDESWKALRSVVELHSPFDNLAGEFCTICTAMEDKNIYTLYPCPTIQAIEEQLK